MKNLKKQVILSAGIDFYFGVAEVNESETGVFDIKLLHKANREDDWFIVSEEKIEYKNQEVVGVTVDYKMEAGLYKCILMCDLNENETIFAESKVYRAS